MKKVFSIFIFLILIIGQAMAQEKVYVIFEFMKVDNDQMFAYSETEGFWENIHKQRVQNGDIIGWDLWSLIPGGEDQGYQYMTVTLFDDPVKMFQAGDHIMEMAAKAYPDLSEDMMMEKFNQTVNSRDLSERFFVEFFKRTNGDFVSELGTIGALTFMKAANGQSGNYEMAETEVFYPIHQNLVDNGVKGFWSFGRVMLPYGSENKASHLTVNMYSDYQQFVDSMNANGWEGQSEENIKKANEGRQARDLKWVYIGKLVRKVR